MINSKFKARNITKKANTIVDIRIEILTAIRKIKESLDREKYFRAEMTMAYEELEAIAKLVRDKDMYMEYYHRLYQISSKDRDVNEPLIEEMRALVLKFIRDKRANITMKDYDKIERPIVFSELDDVEKLIIEKDRLIPKNKYSTLRRKDNPHIERYFNLDIESDVEL
ncbi:MAG: hypothetical protein IKE01_05505 [Clostridia bacterium]|nr:hypothetical protein [Clostridia bacterium]